MTEPTQVLLAAALKALAGPAEELRRRGWDAQLLVETEYDDPPGYVSLRIRLPEVPIPIEAARGICQACRGAGEVPGDNDEPEECAACGGKGVGP